MRRVVHIDMDAFFASVEVVRDPSLAGRPLIIGGRKGDLRGVVSTASYEARVFGVRSAMPIATAVKLCPQGIFMRGTMAHYVEASKKVRGVLETVTPVIQFASIDEAYMDVTGSLRLFGGDDGIAGHIRSEIRAATGLPCTVAISSNKLVSKVASDAGKPDGYVRIAPGDEAAYFAPLPVGKLPGIGPRMREALHARRIRTLGELAAVPEKTLEGWFGAGASGLARRARGESKGKVEVHRVPKSMGRETTFSRDVSDWGKIERTLSYLAERTAYALREQGMEGRCVNLKVRYAPFETKTFAVTLPAATSVDSEIFEALQGLVAKARVRRDPVRLIGMSLSQLTFGEGQMALFGDARSEKWSQALKGVDSIRQRHGFESLRSGRSVSVERERGREDPPTP